DIFLSYCLFNFSLELVSNINIVTLSLHDALPILHVDNGAYVDGKVFDDLLELTKRSGVTIDEVYGDKAYFRKPILDTIKEIGAEAYIPVSEMAYKIDEDLYSYNKDSDEWFCAQGNKTLSKVYRKKKNGRES